MHCLYCWYLLNFNDSFSGLITSVGEEWGRADFVCYRILTILWALFGGVPFRRGASDRLYHLIVAVPGPYI